MLKPVFTEKSLKMAKLGKYTFSVGLYDTKASLKKEMADVFGVHATSVKTVKTGPEKGRNIRGRLFTKPAAKKAVFTIKDGEKLDIFEESK